MSFESFVTRRYLKIKHERKLVPLITVLATLGVAVGVMVLLVVIAVMTGFQAELKNRILGIEAHLFIMRYNAWIDDYRQVTSRVEEIEGVVSAVPYVHAQGMLRSPKGIQGVQLRGIDPRKNAVHVRSIKGQDLSQLTRAEKGQPGLARIVLGEVLAEKLNVQVGDTLMMMVAGSGQTDPRMVPKMHRLKIIGLFETGMHQYDGILGFMNLHDLQNLLGVSDLATGIEVRLLEPDNVEAIAEQVTRELGFQYWVYDWKNRHRNLFSMLAMQKVVMYVIMTLIILVAAFNIASALIMMVKEKTKEISILKAMGATHASIQKIFLGKGIAIGLLGIFLGMGLGLVVCLLLSRYPVVELPGDVYFLTTLPVRIGFWDLVGISVGTFGICLLASYYPARQAARMNPVDALRYG